MRLVSLVPSLTETLAELGVAASVIGVTRYCEVGAPPDAALVGGTKNPDLEAVVTLAPDLVLANTEENRPDDLRALRAAGLRVHETFPRTVADVPGMLESVGAAVGAPVAGARLAGEVREAVEADASGTQGPRTLVLVWRRPWIAAGPDTYVVDLLRVAGLRPVSPPGDPRWPRLDPDSPGCAPQLVLLPDEPYAFGPDDLPAVADVLGPVPTRFIDGRMLTWHGRRTAHALRTLRELVPTT